MSTDIQLSDRGPPCPGGLTYACCYCNLWDNAKNTILTDSHSAFHIHTMHVCVCVSININCFGCCHSFQW